LNFGRETLNRSVRYRRDKSGRSFFASKVILMKSDSVSFLKRK
jgi:hypothetical protein